MNVLFIKKILPLRKKLVINVLWAEDARQPSFIYKVGP